MATRQDFSGKSYKNVGKIATAKEIDKLWDTTGKSTKLLALIANKLGITEDILSISKIDGKEYLTVNDATCEKIEALIQGKA